MFINDFQYEPPRRKSFDCADGEHAIKIKAFEFKTSKSGKRMMTASFLVKDSNNILYVENYVEGEYFNQNMSRLFDSFDVELNNFNADNWVGKIGRGVFAHKEESFTGSDGTTKTYNKCYMINTIPLEGRAEKLEAIAKPQEAVLNPVPTFSALQNTTIKAEEFNF